MRLNEMRERKKIDMTMRFSDTNLLTVFCNIIYKRVRGNVYSKDSEKKKRVYEGYKMKGGELPFVESSATKGQSLKFGKCVCWLLKYSNLSIYKHITK